MFDGDYGSYASEYYSESLGNISPPPRKRRQVSRAKQQLSEERVVEAFLSKTARAERRARLTEAFRRENELFRKPCGVCHNLVRPELMKQHNAAYHPTV